MQSTTEDVEKLVNWAGEDPQNPELLLEELRDYVRTSPLGGVGLYHPFALQPMFYSWKIANEGFLYKQQKYHEALKAGQVESAIGIVERPWRLQYLHLLWASKQITSEQMREALPWVWTDAEPHSELRWLVLFRHAYKVGGLLQDPERPLLDQDLLTIYRGQPTTARKHLGIAWSLQKHTAEFFATRFGHSGVVLQAEVKRAQVYAYFENRGEAEVITHPKFVKIVDHWRVVGRGHRTTDQMYQMHMGSTEDAR